MSMIFIHILNFGAFFAGGQILACQGSPEKACRGYHIFCPGPIPLEADCMNFQLFLGWRLASTTHYN